MSFGLLLRKLRIQSGLTQQQLADLSALSVRAVRDLERGRVHRPRLATVSLLADTLSLDGSARAGFIASAIGDPPFADAISTSAPHADEGERITVFRIDDGEPNHLLLEIRIWRDTAA